MKRSELEDGQEIINERDMPTVQQRLDKLNKRAKKLGVEPMTLVIHAEEFIDDPEFAKLEKKLGKMSAKIIAPKLKQFVVSLKGAAPKLSGWKFIGTLDHYSIPGKVMVHTVPSESIPERFYNDKPVCDHCNRIRNRKETFVVENEEGDIKQIGRMCLKDFMGHNPNSILTIMNLIGSVFDDLGSGGGYYEHHYDLVDMLTKTSAMIKRYGWTSRGAACPEDGRFSTAGEVLRLLNPPIRRQDYEEWRTFADSVKITKSDKEEALNAIEWLNEQEANNEYMHNIKAIAETGVVSDKLSGYACSIVSAYQRAMERLKINLAQKKLNEHLGEIKEKIEATVKIVAIRYFDGYYGSTKMHRMVDEDGRTLTWFASTGSCMQEGLKYKIKGTVKKHDEYKEWKQTVLTRVKVLEEVEIGEED